MERAGLRERKKRQTHRALSQAAQELVHQRGLENVTIEEIADAAGVSVRTFFNYFACKEEAIVGIEPGVVAEMGEELIGRPAEEGPIEALRAVIVAGSDADTVSHRWRLRNELVSRYPALLPRHLASMLQVEAALGRAMAVRAGVDPETNPSPRILVAAVLASLRAVLAWWEESARTEPLGQAVDRAFAQVATVLGEASHQGGGHRARQTVDTASPP